MQLPFKQSSNVAPVSQAGGQRLNPQAAGAEGRQLQSFGQSVAKIQDAWHKAEVSTNYTTSKNNRTAQINQLLFDAENNQDSSGEARQAYLDQLDTVGVGKMGDDRVQSLWDSESNLAVSNAKLRVNQFYRQKMVTQLREQLVIAAEDSKNEYVNLEIDNSDPDTEVAKSGIIAINKEIKQSSVNREKEVTSHAKKQPASVVSPKVTEYNQKVQKEAIASVMGEISDLNKEKSAILEGDVYNKQIGQRIKAIDKAIQTKKDSLEKKYDKLFKLGVEGAGYEDYRKDMEVWKVEGDELIKKWEDEQVALKNIKVNKFREQALAEAGRGERILSRNKLRLNAVKDRFREESNVAFEAGAISELEYRSRLKEIDEWEKDRAIEDMKSDPYAVVDNIDSYDLNAKDRKYIGDAARVEVARDQARQVFNKQVDRSVDYKHVTDAIDNGTFTPDMFRNIKDEEIRLLAEKRYAAQFPAGAARIRQEQKVAQTAQDKRVAKREKDAAERSEAQNKQSTYIALEDQLKSMFDDDDEILEEQNDLDTLIGFQKAVLRAELKPKSEGGISASEREYFLKLVRPVLNELQEEQETGPGSRGGLISALIAGPTGLEDHFRGGTKESVARFDTSKAILDIATRLHPDNTYIMNRERIRLNGLVFDAVQEDERENGSITPERREKISKIVMDDFIKNSNELGRTMVVGGIYTYGPISYQMKGRNDRGEAQVEIYTGGKVESNE